MSAAVANVTQHLALLRSQRPHRRRSPRRRHVRVRELNHLRSQQQGTTYTEGVHGRDPYVMYQRRADAEQTARSDVDRRVPVVGDARAADPQPQEPSTARI